MQLRCYTRNFQHIKLFHLPDTRMAYSCSAVKGGLAVLKPGLKSFNKCIVIVGDT